MKRSLTANHLLVVQGGEESLTRCSLGERIHLTSTLDEPQVSSATQRCGSFIRKPVNGPQHDDRVGDVGILPDRVLERDNSRGGARGRVDRQAAVYSSEGRCGVPGSASVGEIPSGRPLSAARRNQPLSAHGFTT